VHALGLKVFFHSDGSLGAILSDLAACGLDGIQGLEPEAGMKVRTAREQVGLALTLWGNLSFEFMGKPRTDAEIANAISDLISASSGQGIAAEGEFDHLFLGSCAGLVQGMDVNTVRRVYSAITNLA
jgi:uroporphyrinogen decarboxylase